MDASTRKPLSKLIYNQQLVLSRLFRLGRASRMQLGEELGLNPAVLTRVCASLLEQKMIVETGARSEPAGGQRGRRRQLLALNHSSIGIIGIHYDHAEVVAAVIDLRGHVRWTQSWREPYALDTRRRRVVHAVQAALQASPIPRARLLAIGVGDPGIVDSVRGQTIRAVMLPGWRDVPIAQDIGAVTDIPVILDRFDGFQALGEAAFGAGQGARNVLLVTLTDGVGGGIVESGRLLRGGLGAAGEIGHLNMGENGPMCGCGLRGCLEAHITPTAQFRRLVSEIETHGQAHPAIDAAGDGPHDKYRAMLAAARDDHALARNVLLDCAELLGRALGSMINLLNPDRIVLGGLFVDAEDLIMASVTESTRRHALPELGAAVAVQTATLGDVPASYRGMIQQACQTRFAVPGPETAT